MYSLDDTTLLSMAGDIRFDSVAADAAPRRAASPRRGWARPLLRQALGLRGPAHALLADAHGVWAWTPDDRFAAATRHGGVREWMRKHEGCDMRLWVSGDLTRSIEDVASLPRRGDASLRTRARQAFVDRHGDAAASWPLATWKSAASLGVLALAGIDLDALRLHGAQSDVRIRSVEPWWHHAFMEARRCVPALARLRDASVCVVEGRAAAWITTTHGALDHVRHCRLEHADVASLRALIGRMAAEREDGGAATVVLGQGLADGRDTGAIPAFVLGRLDGAQPPQWLRPATRREVH